MSDEPSSLAQALQAKHEEVNNEQQPEDQQPATSAPATTESSTNGKTKKKHSNGYDLGSFESFPALGKSSSPANSGSPSLGGNAWGSSPGSPSLDGNRGSIKLNTVTDIVTMKLQPQQQQNGSELIKDLLNKLAKSGGVSVESSTSKIAGTTTFILKGSAENVSRAKTDIRKALAIKTTKTIQVPASVRASIIGSKGATLKPIIEKSGCAIQVSRDISTPAADEDDEELVDVKIEGDIEGIQIAENEIMSIVKSKVRDLTTKLKIDQKFKPFVEQQFKNTEGVKLTFPEGDSPIILSGERSVVLEAKSNIDQYVKKAVAEFASSPIAIPKAKQPFINYQDVFNNTGVTVYFGQDETVSIFGPNNKLSKAREYITKQVGSLVVLTLDIARAHDKSVEHAENLALYFSNSSSSKLSSIEKENNVQIKVPTKFSGNDVVVEIVGTDAENIKQAKKNLVGVVNSLPPSHVKRVSDIDEFFRSHVNKLAKKIQNEYYVAVVKSDPLVLVYEGNPGQDEDDFAPGASEIQETLERANAEFDEIRSKQNDITTKVLDIPVEDHKYITGPNNTTLNALIGQNMVTIKLGQSGPELKKESVFIRGIKNEVDRIVKEVYQVIDEGKNYEELSKYTTEFKFPAEHVSKLIGKQGANLTKICDEFGVKIEVDDDGNGTVKGIKKNADEAKARIIAQGKRVADEVTERLKVPNEKHSTLIGQGGRYVRRLEDRYDVRIRFPGSGSDNNNNGSSSEPRTKDEVVIRGPSRGVAKVKEELLDLLKYEEEHSYTEVLKVPSKALPRIIGRQGDFINEIRDNTDTRIDVAHEETDKNDGDKQVSITIVGTKKGVKEAVETINSVVKDVVDTVTESLNVDPKYHKSIIGPGGSTMREIINKACGDEAVSNQRMIHVPKADSGDSVVTVTGNRKHVSKVVKRINEIVDELASRVEMIVEVAPERYGALVGPGGMVKRDLEQEFDMTMYVPQQNSKDQGVKLVGKKEKLEQARVKIQEMAAKQYKVELQIPASLHNDVADRGTFIRRLKNNFDVRVEHGRVTLPKAEAVTVPDEAIGEVLITDNEKDLASKHKWTIVEDGDNTKKSANSTSIPWKLKGTDENCQKAKIAIETALEQAKQHNATGFLWIADPSRYKLVIGSGGKQINKIRDESGCTITMPRSAGNNKKPDEQDVIILRGNSSQLEKAKEMILNSIKN